MDLQDQINNFRHVHHLGIVEDMLDPTQKVPVFLMVLTARIPPPTNRTAISLVLRMTLTRHSKLFQDDVGHELATRR